MTGRADHFLSKMYFSHFIRAIEDEMGAYSLQMILRDVGLEHLLERAPGKSARAEVRASEFAAMQSAIRAYYGSGARGSLNRIGRLVWQRAVEKTPKGWVTYPFVHSLLPTLAGSRVALGMLANFMKKPDGDVSIHLLDTDLIFMDTTSVSTFGQEDDQPICWYTLGLIQACLAWVTGEEKAVDEIACRAMGSEACKFRIDI